MREKLRQRILGIVGNELKTYVSLDAIRRVAIQVCGCEDVKAASSLIATANSDPSGIDSSSGFYHVNKPLDVKARRIAVRNYRKYKVAS